MTQLLHIIGPQGSGKSTLAELIVLGLEQQDRPASIVNADEAIELDNDRVRRRFRSDSVVIIESESHGARHAQLLPGDQVITLGGQAAPSAAGSPQPPTIGTYWTDQGGIYAGIARGTGGASDHHLILRTETVRPGKCTWDQAQAWAATLAAEEGIDWTLPTRAESALLYANLKDQFEATWYWTGEQFSAHGAWTQWFADGGQGSSDKGYEGRARAVRRLVIQSFNHS